MSEPQEESDNDGASGNEILLRSVVLAFINLFPKPTEDQIHAFAGLLEFKFQEFETRMQSLLAPYVEDGFSFKKGIPKDADVGIDHLDTPLETFLLAFYMLVPEPSEQQMLILSVLVNLDLEDLEAKTFDLMHKLMEAPKGHELDLRDIELDDTFEFDDDEPDDPSGEELDDTESPVPDDAGEDDGDEPEEGDEQDDEGASDKKAYKEDASLADDDGDDIQLI